MKTALRLALAAAVLSALPLMAYPVAFSGSGASGVDPLGHSWSTQATGPGAWGMPGLGVGTLAFAGPCCATDFHIEFFGLQRAIIDYDVILGGPGGFDNSTRFSATSDGLLWTRVPDSLSAVSFYAPAGTSLAPGELFFVNVTFIGDYDPDAVSFEASWTGVPEPGTWMMLASGLAAVAGMRLRKKA